MNRTCELFLYALLKQAHTVNDTVHNPCLYCSLLYLGNHSENGLVELLFILQEKKELRSNKNV